MDRGRRRPPPRVGVSRAASVTAPRPELVSAAGHERRSVVGSEVPGCPFDTVVDRFVQPDSEPTRTASDRLRRRPSVARGRTVHELRLVLIRSDGPKSRTSSRARPRCVRDYDFRNRDFLTPKPALKRQIDQNRKWIIRGIDVLRGVISILKSILDPTFASTGAVPKETFLRRRVRRTPRCSGRAERAVRGDAREARRLAHRGGLHREQRPELHRQRTRHLSARTVARVGRSLGPRNGRRRESDCRPVAPVGDVASASDYETPLYV